MTSKKCGSNIVDASTAMQATAQSLKNIEQYYYGMPDLANIRSYEAIRVTLRDTALAIEKGMAGLVWVAPETYSPYKTDPTTEVDFRLTRGEIDLLRQWFNSLEDLNPHYLRRKDYKLAVRIHDHLGARIANSVKKGAGINPPNPMEQRTGHLVDGTLPPIVGSPIK